MTYQKSGGIRPNSSHPIHQTPPRHPQKQCTRCGKTPSHAKQLCPAIKAECKKCGKRGHYQLMCKTQMASELNTECASASDDSFLLTVDNLSSKNSDTWTVDLTVNNIPIKFKIDTGADVTAISPKEFSKLKGTTLTQASKVLHSPAKHPLKVNGQFTGKLSYKQVTTHDEIFVVDGQQQPLMGRPAIEALNLLSRVNIVSSSEKFLSLYPNLFHGLGTFGTEYHIVLKQGAKPFALSVPRRVALPLLPKVKAKLARMEKLGAISKVDTPTEWCAGMVVVPKSNDDIRICVDLTKLNESVCREKHILPSVEQILGNSTVFTKLDANAGFWQIKLSQESSPLTTFITSYGRFRFNRLPFGIISAPEFLQKQMSKILNGLPGVLCMIDNVLVHGTTQQEHDQRLIAVLECLRKANVTLNKDKCQFSRSSITFLGQLIDQSGVHPEPNKVLAIQGIKEPTNITEL